MRLLVIQLARFGDIYQTWPVLNALKRKYPDGEVHVLTRARFREALIGLKGIHTHALPTADILRPVFEASDEAKALVELNAFLDPLLELNFDEIVNLSFSPVSSYLTDSLAHAHTAVSGYTRSSDGFLRIPDDTSAFFYAQVGVGRANRYHLGDIFAAVAGVELIEEDWNARSVPPGERENKIVVHLGASTTEKTYPPELWVKMLRELSFRGRVILVGSRAERALAETVASQVGDDRIVNRVGGTTLPELMGEISSAKLLIGADSAPVHMASLTNTPVLNLSSATVNFWETGPVTPGSRVLYADRIDGISPSAVAGEASAMLEGREPQNPVAVRDERSGLYRTVRWEPESFSWRLIESLYTGSEYPALQTKEDALAFQRLFEVAELAIQQLDRWEDPKARPGAAQILEQVDMMLVEIPRMNSRVEPVVQWFQVQRLRIPPGTAAETLTATRKAFEDLIWVSAVYREFGTAEAESKKAAELCLSCATEIREWNFAAVSEEFQSLVSKLHELARHSSRIAPHLAGLNSALERKDYVELADHLQWVLAPALEAKT